MSLQPNSNFLIPISLQPNVIILYYFKLRNLLYQNMQALQIKGPVTPSSGKDMWIGKFVTSHQLRSGWIMMLFTLPKCLFSIYLVNSYAPSQEVVLLELWNLCFPNPPNYLFSYILNTQLFIHIQEQGIFDWKPRGFFTSNQLKLMKWLLINLMKLSSLIDWLIGRRRTDSWMLRICRRRLRRSRGWSRRRERSSSSSTIASEPPTSARIDTG